MKRLIAVFFVVIFLASCNLGNVPKGIIKEKVIVSLLTDIHVVDGYIATVRNDSVPFARSVYRSVFDKYQSDSTQFVKSLKYYSTKPQQLQTIYDQVIVNLEKLQELENKNLDKRLQQKKMLERKKQMRLDRLKNEENKKNDLPQ